MQDTAKARAIPLLKIDNDFDQRWLEFTVQVSDGEAIICDASVKYNKHPSKVFGPKNW